MLETIVALIFAHAMADFTLQTNWINANKARPHVMALHGIIVWITAHLALGQLYAPALALLTLAHILIDAAKTYSKINNLPGGAERRPGIRRKHDNTTRGPESEPASLPRYDSRLRQQRSHGSAPLRRQEGRPRR